MIVIPGVIGLGLAVGLALIAINNMGRAAEDLTHAADDGYDRQGTNGWWLIGPLIASSTAAERPGFRPAGRADNTGESAMTTRKRWFFWIALAVLLALLLAALALLVYATWPLALAEAQL